MTFMFLWCQAVDTRLQVKLADVQEQNEELEFRILELEEANAKVGGGGGWGGWSECGVEVLVDHADLLI